MLWWRSQMMRRALVWALALSASGCVVVFSAGCKAPPNPLPGRWEGVNSQTGKTVYWEFYPDGRLFTDNFTAQTQFSYRVEQPDALRISFSGKFDKDVQADELVYHFVVENDMLIFRFSGYKDRYKRVPGS